MSFLDFLFPKRCIQCKKFGSYLCTNCFATISFAEIMVCTVCQKQAIGGLTHPVCKTRYTIDGVFPSLVYKGVVKKLVYVFKYPPYLIDLSQLLVDLLNEGVIQKEYFIPLLKESSVIIPLPLHISKFRRRRYNQSVLLAEGLGKRFDLHISDCLKRVEYKKSQVGLSKEERKINITEAFACKDDIIEIIKNYENALLIDDVVTSGATFREAARVLKKAGFQKVWGMTLAHGE